MQDAHQTSPAQQVKNLNPGPERQAILPIEKALEEIKLRTPHQFGAGHEGYYPHSAVAALVQAITSADRQHVPTDQAAPEAEALARVLSSFGGYLAKRPRRPARTGGGEGMSEVATDHLRLLALARRALDAEIGPLWRTSPEDAIEGHGAACDALWDELRRQVEMQDGKVPVLEHPTVKQRALAKRMRRDILVACQAAIEQALDEVEFSG